jgi:hypothetical protein
LLLAPKKSLDSLHSFLCRVYIKQLDIKDNKNVECIVFLVL